MIITPKEVGLLSPKDKPQRKIIVGVTSGCFDLLHYYHLHYLERCRAKCDFLIVGVDSDEMIQGLKKKNPVIPEHHRLAMVAALRCVDAAFTLRSLKDFYEVSEHSDFVFKNTAKLYGNDIHFDKRAELLIIPDVNEMSSTTEIVKSIRRKNRGRT